MNAAIYNRHLDDGNSLSRGRSVSSVAVSSVSSVPWSSVSVSSVYTWNWKYCCRIKSLASLGIAKRLGNQSLVKIGEIPLVLQPQGSLLLQFLYPDVFVHLSVGPSVCPLVLPSNPSRCFLVVAVTCVRPAPGFFSLRIYFFCKQRTSTHWDRRRLAGFAFIPPPYLGTSRFMTFLTRTALGIWQS